MLYLQSAQKQRPDRMFLNSFHATLHVAANGIRRHLALGAGIQTVRGR